MRSTNKRRKSLTIFGVWFYSDWEEYERTNSKHRHTEQPQKIFTVEKAGALKEINFKFAKKPSKEELKFLTDLRQGLIDGNKY